jgi:hypothetical protein
LARVQMSMTTSQRCGVEVQFEIPLRRQQLPLRDATMEVVGRRGSFPAMDARSCERKSR